MSAKRETRHSLALAAALLSLSALAMPARAADCGPLQKLFSLDLTMAPNGIASIPVTINGSARRLQFSTAGGRSILSEGALDSLGLHAVSGNVKLLDRSGNASQRSVTIGSLVIGGMEAKDRVFLVSPDPNFGGNPQLPVDGTLANDILENYDLDLDYAGGKVSYFVPDHCEGHVVYWTTSQPSVIPFRHDMPGSRNMADTHIYFHVTLDGKDLLAALNTAGARSQMSARAAGTYDVNEDTKGTVPMGTLAGKKVFGYTFKAISFGDVTVNNPRVTVFPDVVGRNDPNNVGRTDSRVAKVDDIQVPDISIGMDVIRQLHIYIAAKEGKMYITAAGPAPGAQPQPAPAQPTQAQ
jgi:hypothetical protein